MNQGFYDATKGPRFPAGKAGALLFIFLVRELDDPFQLHFIGLPEMIKERAECCTKIGILVYLFRRKCGYSVYKF